MTKLQSYFKISPYVFILFSYLCPMHVYLDDKIECLGEAEVARMLTLLPEWRREQAMRFKHLAGQRECAQAYLLLMQALREKYGITTPPHFQIGPHGKPYLTEFPLIHFNLSHCKKAVICVLHDSPVGVDIECIRPFKSSLADYTMNEEEIRQINSSAEPAVEFTRLWTAKEACVKLSGKGLQDGIKDILTNARCLNIQIETHQEPGSQYVYSIAKL